MSRIVATGSYLPEKILTNKELIKRTGIDSNDEWITQRTAFINVILLFENETVSDLAIQSAKNLLKQLDAEIVQEIHLILVKDVFLFADTFSCESSSTWARNQTSSSF